MVKTNRPPVVKPSTLVRARRRPKASASPDSFVAELPEAVTANEVPLDAELFKTRFLKDGSMYSAFLVHVGEKAVDVGEWSNLPNASAATSPVWDTNSVGLKRQPMLTAQRTVQLRHHSKFTSFVATALKIQTIREYRDGSFELDERSVHKGIPFADQFAVYQRLGVKPSSTGGLQAEGWVSVGFRKGRGLAPKAKIKSGSVADCKDQQHQLLRFALDHCSTLSNPISDPTWSTRKGASKNKSHQHRTCATPLVQGEERWVQRSSTRTIEVAENVGLLANLRLKWRSRCATRAMSVAMARARDDEGSYWGVAV